MPTGGVNLDNAEEWIKAGAIALGVGGDLTAPAKNDDYDKVTELAKQFVEKLEMLENRRDSYEKVVTLGEIMLRLSTRYIIDLFNLIHLM